MKITNVVTKVVPFSGGTWLDETRLSTPMVGSARFEASRSSWRGPGADLCWILVETDSPTVWGIGQTRAGRVAEVMIQDHLTHLIVGQDPLDVRARAWEMETATAPYARGGIAAMATGGVELALWDLSARAADVPLAQLLGGEPRELPFYLTCASASEIDSLPAGLLGEANVVKVPARWGPTDADALERTISDLRDVRAVVPTHIPIAIDAWMSWSAPFALEVSRAGADIGLAWIEEPLSPTDLEGYSRLASAAAPVSIAAGEHVFGFEEGDAFVARSGVGVFQPDVTWCGGLTTSQRLGDLARSRGIRFIPHAAGNQPWACHLLASLGKGALAELVVNVGTPANAMSAPRALDVPGVGIAVADVGF